MPTLQSYADRLADIIDANPKDPRIGPMREAIKAEVVGGDLAVDASPELAKTLRNIEVQHVAKDPGTGGALVVGAGRGFRATQSGVQQLAEGKASRDMWEQSGLPPELYGDKKAAESLSIGAPYIYATEPQTFRGMQVGRTQEKTFKPTPEQAQSVRTLTTLDKTLATQRSGEREIYQQGVAERHPVASLAGEMVGGVASLPVPLSGFKAGAGPLSRLAGMQVAPRAATAAATVGARAAVDIGAEAANAAARNAGFRTGAAVAAKEAPVAAASGGIQETEEGQSRVIAALESAAIAGTLSVGSEVIRGLIYKLRTRQRITPDEQRIIDEASAPAAPAAPVAAPAPQIPAEMAEALKSNGVDLTPNTAAAVEVLRGALNPAQKAEMLAKLTPDEIASLSPAQAERLALFRRMGYEPTPAQVLGDYKGMEDLARAEMAQMDEAGNTVREKMAQARQAPIEVLKKSQQEAGGGIPTEDMGGVAKLAIADTGIAQKAGVGVAYKSAAEQAAAGGYRVVPTKMAAAVDEVYPQFRVGEAGQMSAMMQTWATHLEKSLPEDVIRQIRTEVREDLTKGLLRPQEEGPALFKKYSEAVGEIDPIVLEKMRQEVGQMKVTTPGDMRVKSSLIAAIDEDILQMPEDVYKAARAAATERFTFIRQVPELAKLFKDPAAISDEQMYAELMKLPLQKWKITDEWVERHGTKDSRNLWGATKKMMASKFYDDLLMSTTSKQLGVATEQGGERVAQLNSASFANYLDKLSKSGRLAKVEALIGKKGIEELGMVRRYLQSLEVPKTGRSGSNPSGTGVVLLDTLRGVVDKYAESGDPSKRAFGNFLNNTINKGAQVFAESPDAAAKRIVRQEVTDSVSERAASRMADIRARAAANAQVKREGFTKASDAASTLMQRGASRQERE